jgi:CobQ/CobB/MinD/ParA nucleotide binding domain
MATIHMIGGEKGGVGKSLTARLLAQYFIDHSLPFIGFDADRSHGALLRFYASYTTPIVVDDYQSLDRIVESATAEPDRRVLVDLAAQTHLPVTKWMEESRLLEISKDLNIRLVYWHVMDNSFDSVELLRRLLDQFNDRLPLVLVMNQVRGERFDLLEASCQRTRAEGLGAKTVVLHRLAESTMHKIDAESRSFWSAMNQAPSAEGNLGMLEQQRVWVWVKRAYEEIDKVGV